MGIGSMGPMEYYVKVVLKVGIMGRVDRWFMFRNYGKCSINILCLFVVSGIY